MTHDPLFPRLAAALRDVIGATRTDLTPRSSPDNTPEWDSVASLHFIAAVEEEFGVIVTTTDNLKFKTLGDWAAFIQGQLDSTKVPGVQ